MHNRRRKDAIMYLDAARLLCGCVLRVLPRIGYRHNGRIGERQCLYNLQFLVYLNFDRLLDVIQSIYYEDETNKRFRNVKECEFLNM